uniref:Amino acid transporter transmembrane domain-containing protein n=1 Tax=Zooxanthella nutricula TaxID=1333877 RepID=A0A7S2JKZ4_9DINO
MYKYCVCGTFLITLPMCFGDLQKTKNFTYVIMTARFIAVVLMVTISSMRSYHRFQEEGAAQVLSTVKLWETDQFMAVFGNGVFLFAIHHYLPSMISPLEPQRKAPQVIATAFGISYVLILIVSATAMVAWGGEALECSQHPGGHFCQVQPLYNLNFVPLGWFGGSMAIFIASYPSMAIVNIPIAAITTRNTMAQWLGITLSGAENPYTFTNICMTLVVLVPPSVVALITKNVQVVIAYVGGYAGLTTAVLCPLVVLVKCRELLSLDEGELQVLRRPLKSAFGNKKGYTFVCLMYALALILVTKKLFIDPKAPAPHP